MLPACCGLPPYLPASWRQSGASQRTRCYRSEGSSERFADSCAHLRRHQAFEVEHLHDFIIERQQSRYVRRQLAVSWQTLRLREFAFSGHWHGGSSQSALSTKIYDQVKLSLGHLRPNQHGSYIGNWHNLVATQHDSGKHSRSVRKRLLLLCSTLSLTRQLAHLLGRKSKALLPHGKDNEVFSCFALLYHAPATALAPASRLRKDASMRATSALLKNASGRTTGITFPLISARPRYQFRSSPEKAFGKACIALSSSMDSIASTLTAARAWRRTSTLAGRAIARRKCSHASTMK